jgi:hypothetical protein
LNETQLLAHLASEISQQKKLHEAACSRGSPKDFAEYKNLCGVIQGLGIALEFINDLVQKLEHDDE